MRWIIVFLTLLCAAPALAQNGRECTTAERQEYGKGPVSELWCYVLLDAITTASGGPITLNLATIETRDGDKTAALPDQLGIWLTQTDCSAGTVSFTTSHTEGGIETNLTAPNATIEVAGGATDTTGIKGDFNPMGTLLHSTWIDVAGCTGGFTIIAIGHEVKQ